MTVVLSEREPTVERVKDLTDRDRDILGFERQWWKHAGAKDSAIRETFELSPTRYYQLLNDLLDEPAALALDAPVVLRLRRLRQQRLARRDAVRLRLV